MVWNGEQKKIFTPYEEFLKRALEDENSDSEIEDIQIEEDDDFETYDEEEDWGE